MKPLVTAITGASSGIGKALAYQFAKQGHHLSLCARSFDKLQEIQNHIEQTYGTKVLIAKVDITREEEVKSWIEATVNQFQQLNVLINNAGISMRALFQDLDLEVIRKVMDVNFWGTVYATKYALPYLMNASPASIIGISSIAGFRGLPGRTGYAASKFAMHGLLESIRVELMPYGVHVLIVAPWFTASNIRKYALTASGEAQGETPLPESQLMSAEKVAQLIYKAWKRKQKYLILTLQGKLTVWLSRLFPSWTDTLVYDHFAKEKDSPLPPRSQWTKK